MATVLGYLRGLDVVPAPQREPLTPVDELVERYRQWSTTQRGLADRTVGRYVDTARRMLDRTMRQERRR